MARARGSLRRHQAVGDDEPDKGKGGAVTDERLALTQAQEAAGTATTTTTPNHNQGRGGQRRARMQRRQSRPEEQRLTAQHCKPGTADDQRSSRVTRVNAGCTVFCSYLFSGEKASPARRLCVPVLRTFTAVLVLRGRCLDCFTH